MEVDAVGAQLGQPIRAIHALHRVERELCLKPERITTTVPDRPEPEG